MSLRLLASEKTGAIPVFGSKKTLEKDGWTVLEGFQLKPGYILTQVRAISARVNQNYDGWPSEELKKAYKTFIGKPCFVNHENHDPTKARGVVVASRYVENGADRYVEVVQEIDAQRFPKLAHEIKTGGMDSVSMGAEAGFTICSYCYNKATDLHDMCDHVRNHKGKTLTRFDKRTGKKEDVLVFESCLVPGTPVLMADGTTKGVEKVQVGDRVIDHLGESRLVTETMSRLVTEDIVRLRRTGHPGWLELTGNHPILVVRSADAAYPSSKNGKHSFSKEAFARKLDQGRVRPEFVNAADVREGDWVVEVIPQLDGGMTKIVTADYTTPRNIDWVAQHHAPDTSRDEEFFPDGLYAGRWKSRDRQPWIRRSCHADGCDSIMELRPSDRARMYCSSMCAGTWRKGKNIGNKNGNLTRHNLPDTIELTESFGRLVGWFLAEGSVSSAAVNFALHADETEQAQEIVNLARDCLGLTSVTVFNPTPTTLSVTVFSAPFARLMSVFGTQSGRKGLPDEFMAAPLEFLRGVADAHELGDGLHGNEASPEGQRKDSVRSHVHRHFTVSDRLASQLYLIHLMLGRTPSHTTKKAFRDNWSPLHDVWWKNLAARHGRNTLTVRGKMAYGPWVFTRVRDVESRPYSGAVHNLEVADSHTYTANGLAVHNCHKISFFELSYVFEPADETAVASKVVVAGLNKKVNGWASRKREDPRNETDEAPGLPNGKFSAVNLSRNVPYVGHNIPVSEGNYYRSLHTDSFDSLFDKDGVMRGNGRGGTDNLSFMSGNPLEMYTNGITKSNTIIEGDSRLPISSTDKRSGYSYVPQLNRTDVDSGATPLRVWRRKAVGSEPIESVHNWEKVYDSFPSEHRQAGKHTKQGFAADIAEITKLAGPQQASVHKHAGECPPGVDCSVKGLQTVEQITKDSPNNPVNQVSYSPDNIGQASSSTGGGGGAGGYGDAKEMAHTKGLYEDLMKTFPGADIGTFRVDDFHEHDHGAMDFMTSDDAQAAAVREKAFASGAPYVLWKQQQWNSDGSVSGMENRGDPTQNHYDHVHIAPIPVPAAPEPAATSAAPSPAPTQRAAGKYTKDDFAIADGKKPWEREAPGPSEEADLKEIEAMVRMSIVKHPVEAKPSRRKVRSAALRKVAHNRAMKLAWGEVEAPTMVDTLREEGSAPEDDNNDFERYVDPPEELADPDLSAASRIDRQQEMQGTGDPAAQGVPGAAEGGAPPQQPQQQFITLQVPVPAAQDAGVPMAATPAAAAPQAPPMAPPQQPQQVMASTLDYFERYYGRRIANWMDAIEARRKFTPEEFVDYQRQTARLSTLENSRELSTTNRNPTKGTANMARTNIASRTKVATAGRRQHFAEGPLVDGGDRGRNNQGEQEEAFISQTPPEVSGEFPGDDAHNISNTEHNLVARVQRGRDQLLRDANQLASIRQRRAFDEAGGPVATTVDPKVQTGPEGEALTGDDFTSANPNEGVSPTNPKDASLRAFQAFDGWLAQKTGKSSRRHNEATIKKAAAQFSREAGISPQALFPALGIVLREARKSEKQANSKGASMRKRSNESLEVAAPDARIDVVSPVKNVSDAKAQASQFDVHDFGNNAGDGVAKPDLSTDQNWAPGEASKTSARVKTAGGLLAMRCAEGMIEAGLEPNSRDRKYQLAAEFENMNRNLIQDRVALLERFAAVRQADLQRVASGSSRGAARSPIPAGLGGGTRTAATGQRLAAHDPRNDSSLFI